MASLEGSKAESLQAERDSTGHAGPVWVLQLIEYSEKQLAIDRSESDVVHPVHDLLRNLGSRIIMDAWIVDQFGGDSQRWSRVSVAQFRDQEALAEIVTSPVSAAALERFETARQEGRSLRMFPTAGDPIPSQVSAISSNSRLLMVQIVEHPGSVDLADGIESTRIGRFRVGPEHNEGDDYRQEVRFDLVSSEVAADLATKGNRSADRHQVLIARAQLDDIARSLQDPTRVVF